MSTIVLQSTSEGLVVPPEVLEGAGIGPGELLELVRLPGPQEIVHRALRFTVWKLGDAIGVGKPAWRDGEWVVRLRSREGEDLGDLFLDAHGEVLLDKSATYESVRGDPHAPNPANPAA